MRIISGNFKGRRFNPPLSKTSTRPTMDMAKEGIFNIISNYFDFEEAKVLDLFGGTGSISFEFLSRDCREVTIVENNPVLVRFISSVSNTLDTENNLKIVKDDALKFIKKTYDTFNLIFADPPYNYRYYNDLVNEIFNRNLLEPEGIFIIEHDKTQEFSKHVFFSDLRIYGTNRFSFFSKKTP
ncbi:MAG: 16S rRNA (guanine(966)-N(2))-methyltransferase RsmD [Saprospiraceae bacterium]|nr:16S rRNA (guanine(966)-N(2))-methyltransferase RsmD [Saprospiraceae bacterium]